MLQTQILEDLGSEPSDRGVALRETTAEENPQTGETEEPKEELTEESAKGQEQPSQDSEQTDSQDQVSDENEETDEGGQFEKIHARDVANQMGWSVNDFFRDILVPGADGDITISEAVDNYKELQSQVETLKQERQQLEVKATQASAPAAQYPPEVVNLMNEVNLLEKQFDALQRDGTLDNMEAAEALKIDRKYRYEIDTRKRALQQNYQEWQGKQQELQNQYLAEVDVQLRREIPEWRNAKVRAEETPAMEAWLKSEGAEQARIDAILKFDPFSARLVRRLWQYEKQKAQTEKAVRKVQKVPRSMQPGPKTQAKKPNLKDAGKFVNQAKSRRERDRRLLEVDIDDALLS